MMWNPNIGYRTYSMNYNSPWHHKRKIQPDITDLPPPKMLITEEKMVSQLKGIHLSKDYTSHGTPGSSNSEIEMCDSLSNILNDRKSETLPTLIVCDEVRAFQKKVESPLPEHILSNFRRPTNALVLWRPPAGDLGQYLSNIKESISDDQNKAQSNIAEVEMEDDNNNGSNNQDMNVYITSIKGYTKVTKSTLKMVDAQIKQMKEFFGLFNRISECCFNNCVNSFFERSTTFDENQCLDRCVTKYLSLNHKIMEVFVEIQPTIVQRKMEEMKTKNSDMDSSDI